MKWNLGLTGSKPRGRVTFSYDGQVFTIRILEIRLASRETETLLTNLNQKQLPMCSAGEL